MGRLLLLLLLMMMMMTIDFKIFDTFVLVSDTKRNDPFQRTFSYYCICVK